MQKYYYKQTLNQGKFLKNMIKPIFKNYFLNNLFQLLKKA